MPYASLTNFSGGLDNRKHALASDPGTLRSLKNGHLTRGGDIEKRKAFEIHKTLPAGTYGFEHTLDDGLLVFGSAVDPGVPSGVTYQRLEHPDAGVAMTGVTFSTTYNGNTWVVATFDDNSVVGFYNGSPIAGFYTGLVRSAHSSLDDVATEISEQIDNENDYDSTTSGSIISIFGDDDFSVSTAVVNASGGTDDQFATVATVSGYTASIEEVDATAKIEISSAASGTIDKLQIGSSVIFDSVATGQVTDIVVGDLGLAEITTVTAVANVSDSLDQTYFTIYDEAGSVGVWFDTNASGSDPTGAARAIKVTLTSDDTAAEVATALQSAIDGDTKFSATVSDDEVTITSSTVGEKTDAADNDTSFTIAVSQQGVWLDTYYFYIFDETDSWGVWFNVDSGNSAPAGALLAADTIEVAINSTDSRTQVATAMASAINAETEFTATSSSETVTVTNVETQNIREPYILEFMPSATDAWTFDITSHGNVEFTASNSNTTAILVRAIEQFKATSGGVTGVSIDNAGYYYIGTPTVTFGPPDVPGGTQATGYAVMNNYWAHGNISSSANTVGNQDFYSLANIVITQQGTGYTSPPTLTLSGGTNWYYDNAPSHNLATTVAVAKAKVTSSGEPVRWIPTALGNAITLTAPEGVGADANASVVSGDVDGITGLTGATTTVGVVSNVAGGVDAVAGQEKVVQVTLGGTKDDGDKFTINIQDSALNTKKFGAQRHAAKSPVHAITTQSKMHFIAGSVLYYSEIGDSTEFDDDANGSGLINIFEYSSGSEDLTGMANFQGTLAVFGRSRIQTWLIDPDDTLNQQLQTLNNTGTMAGLSIQTLGDADVIYLDDAGIRSLQPRDSSSKAHVVDVGNPIDDIVLADLASMTESEKADACAIVEPIDKRYWISLNDKIYVYSRFPGSRVSAWSEYEQKYDVASTLESFTDVEKFIAADNRVYFRCQDKDSNDVIMIYGGSDNDTYDASVCEVELPYLDMEKPAHEKAYTGLDFALDGDWSVEMNYSPAAPTVYDYIADLEGSTLTEYGAVDSPGLSSHTKLRLRTTGATAAKLAAVIVHFEGGTSQ